MRIIAVLLLIFGAFAVVPVVGFYLTAPVGFRKTSRKWIVGGAAGFSALVAFFVVTLALVHQSLPRTDMKSAVSQGYQLIASVGGAAQICAESSRLFARLGTSEARFLQLSDVADFPAITALLRANSSETAEFSPFEPPQPHLHIRVGTHRDGYSLVIVGKNGAGTMDPYPSGVNLGDSCIFVRP